MSQKGRRGKKHKSQMIIQIVNKSPDKKWYKNKTQIIINCSYALHLKLVSSMYVCMYACKYVLYNDLMFAVNLMDQ